MTRMALESEYHRAVRSLFRSRRLIRDIFNARIMMYLSVRRGAI